MFLPVAEGLDLQSRQLFLSPKKPQTQAAQKGHYSTQKTPLGSVPSSCPIPAALRPCSAQRAHSRDSNQGDKTRRACWKCRFSQKKFSCSEAQHPKREQCQGCGRPHRGAAPQVALSCTGRVTVRPRRLRRDTQGSSVPKNTRTGWMDGGESTTGCP